MRLLFVYCSTIVLIALVNCDKKSKNNEVEVPHQKKFIGRIEHGKVKVLRAKKPDEDEGNFCNKKGDKCHDEDSADEEPARKKVKYSIKFQHEKQQKNHERNGDVNIMRLHKNSRKKYGKYDDDSSEEDEDESPIKKRFRYMDDED